MESGTIKVLKTLFRDYNKRSVFPDFEYELKSHPDFPTLKSISDTLEIFGFDNTPVRLKPEELQELDSPFLAYINDRGQNELTYAKPRPENEIDYLSERKDKTQVSLEVFSAQFSGIAVLLELNESKIPPVNIKRFNERRLFHIVIALAVLCPTAFLTVNLYQNFDRFFSEGASLIWISSKLIGLALTVALLLKDLGQSGSLINKVCKVGKQADCNTVLESKYATVYAWVKWSDLGFIYFLSSFLLVSTGNLGIVTLLSLAAFPYVFISLYQQLFLIRKLCPLCLGVVALLTTEFVAGLSLWSKATVSTGEFPDATMILLITGSLYLAIKSFILSRRMKAALEFRYNRLKSIPEVVSTVVKRERALTLPEGAPINYLSFGNPEESTLHIQAFLSLYCGHCGSLFEQLNDFLQKHKKVRIDLFLTFSTEDNRHIKVMEDILQTYHTEGAGKAWSMVGTWYAKSSSYPFPKNTYEPTERLKKLLFTTKYLMQLNQISSLPKLFVGGFEKSPHYPLEEYLEHAELLKSLNTKNQKKMIINK